MNSIKKTAYVIIFMALAIALSPFTSIPVGIARINPTQHFVNVFLAVLVGTAWNTGAAAGISVIRNAMGVGTLLAFPGSMIGAVCSGLAYKLTGKVGMAVAGELLGTGVLAPLAGSLVIAPGLMGKEIGFMALFPGFFLSALAGSLLAFIVLKALIKIDVIHTESFVQP
ncbi:MAG: energy coupling factor transporter S component ThiW [Spirochaetales bacterium]|nr:energy coupling factor transporter S component ThiW [Spirochaetales bacterium]